MSRRACRPAAPAAGSRPAATLAWGSYRAADERDGRATAPDGSGDYHNDVRTAADLRRLSRSADRNGAIVAGPLRAAIRLLIGNSTGPRPRPVMTDQAQADALADAWLQEAQTGRFDADGEASMLDLLTLSGLSYLRDGDYAAVHDGTGASVLVEADRILSPADGRTTARVVQGVEYAGRRRAAYWIADYDRNGRLSPSYAKRYGAEQVTFAAYWDRACQTRGVPVFGPSLDDLDHLDSLMEAEIRSSENASLLTAFLKRTDPAAAAIAPGTIRTKAGVIITPPAGHELAAPDLGRPNLNVPEFTRLNLRIALMVLGLPLELLLLDLGALNYAASRSLRNLAEHTLTQWRARIWQRWLTRTWGDWLAARGAPPVEVAWEWPRLELHDRNKEAEADATELENGTTSLRRLVGPDWRAITSERAEERRVIAAERAEELRYLAKLRLDLIADLSAACAVANAAKPSPGVTWRDLLPALANPTALAATPATTPAAATTDSTDPTSP